MRDKSNEERTRLKGKERCVEKRNGLFVRKLECAGLTGKKELWRKRKDGDQRKANHRA